MNDKKTVDYTNYPLGSVDLSDPKSLPHILSKMTGGNLAIVANLVLLLLVKDLPSIPSIAYMCVAAITILGVLSYFKGHKISGETSIQKSESTNES